MGEAGRLAYERDALGPAADTQPPLNCRRMPIHRGSSGDDLSVGTGVSASTYQAFGLDLLPSMVSKL